MITELSTEGQCNLLTLSRLYRGNAPGRADLEMSEGSHVKNQFNACLHCGDGRLATTSFAVGGPDGLSQQSPDSSHLDRAPQTQRTRTQNVDRWPNATARAGVIDVFQRLNTLEPATVGGRNGRQKTTLAPVRSRSPRTLRRV